MLRQLPFTPTDKQLGYLYCMMPMVAFVGGLGSGKTWIDCLKAIMLSLFHPHGNGGIIVAPTYAMLKDTVMVTLEQLFDDLELSDHVDRNISDMKLTMPNGSYFLLRSGENPSRLRGPNLSWGLIDEATLIRKFGAVLTSVSSRLRDSRFTAKDPHTGSPMFTLGITGSPEGELDEVYEKFFRVPKDSVERERWLKKVYTVQASTRENPGADQGFLETLEMNTPEHLRDALIEGQWIDIGSGRCHFNFDREKHMIEGNLSKNYNPKLPLRLTWDFNLSPMTCLVAQIAKAKTNHRDERRRIRFIDEFSINNSNTPEVCRHLIERYGARGLNHRGDIYIYGDAHGDKGTAEKTDYETIREMLESHFPGEIHMRVPNSNPTHKTRVLASNTALANAKRESYVEISRRCMALLNDLEYQRWDQKNPRSKDKGQVVNGVSIGHASDAYEYLIDKEFPYRRPGRQDNETLRALTSDRWGGLQGVDVG